MNDFLANFQRHELTKENKQFFSLRYFSRSLFNLSIFTIISNIFIFKMKYLNFQKIFACYYMGYTLRKINDSLSENEINIKEKEMKYIINENENNNKD